MSSRAVRVPRNLHDMARSIQADFRRQGYDRPLWECVMIAKQTRPPTVQKKGGDEVFGWLKL